MAQTVVGNVTGPGLSGGQVAAFMYFHHDDDEIFPPRNGD